MELTLNETIYKVIVAQFNKTCADLGIDNYEILDEQEFANKEVESNKIYIILASQQGTDFFRSSVLPVEINIISEDNTLKNAKILADTFGTEYTLADTLINVENAYIQQAYTTPQVKSNFEEIDNGYRSIISFVGTFVVAYDIDSVQSITVDGELVKVTGFKVIFTASPDPQPFYISKARANTINKFGSFNINFSIESIHSNFLSKVNSIAIGEESINSVFTFSFSIGAQALSNTELKLVDYVYTQNKGEIPQLSLTFTR